LRAPLRIYAGSFARRARYLPCDSRCLPIASPTGAGCHQGKARKEAMASRAVEIDSQIIAFVLPSIPESVPMARFHVRAALSFHELDKYTNDAEIITSELVANAIQFCMSAATARKPSR
jgi:hypothetical protein